METIIWLALIAYLAWRLRHLMHGRAKSGR